MRVRGQSARRVFDTVISIQEDPICKSITSPFFRPVHLFYVYCRIIFFVQDVGVGCRHSSVRENANFLITGRQWTKERNRLSIDSVRGILLTKYNLKKLSCIDFHAYVSQFLRTVSCCAVASSDKYETLSD